LKPFENEAAFKAVLEKMRASAQERMKRAGANVEFDSAAAGAVPPQSLPVLMESAPMADKSADSAAKPETEESITNVQTAGVDEGGIVKRRGDYLIVLRRGRLFTLRVGGDMLQPIASVDAYGPGIDPNGAWYDEMLVSDRTVVVIGYSYARGGTEIGLFDLDQNGGLKYRATYHMRSNDYYSASNYASRMIGDKLVFYSPMFLNLYAENYEDMLPAVRQWQPNASAVAAPVDAASTGRNKTDGHGDFKRILPAERIYQGSGKLDGDGDLAMHTVTICDLARAEMSCEATAVMAYPGQVFYVSEDSAFVWTVPWNANGDQPKAADVFRIPLDGSAPTALQAKGVPIDQMSFLQKDGYLHVMLAAGGMGQWMWQGVAGPSGVAPNQAGPNQIDSNQTDSAQTASSQAVSGQVVPATTTGGDFALMRVPLSMFGDGSEKVASSQYRPLREPDFAQYGLQNRFVGDWLLLGASRSWDDTPAKEDAFAIRYATDEDFVRVPVGHPVDRVDALGRDGIVIGESRGALHFTALSLSGQPHAAGRYVLAGASQGEQRTHGFFYRQISAGEGIVGLPIIGGNGRDGASVLYVHNRALQLQDAGKLDAQRRADIDDACKASCMDWYGNARPIFIGDRVFALLGYELVEGRFDGQQVRERRRVDFSPSVAIAR
jgi:hypothetical protein